MKTLEHHRAVVKIFLRFAKINQNKIFKQKKFRFLVILIFLFNYNKYFKGV